MDLKPTQSCVSTQPWHTMYIFSDTHAGKVYEVRRGMPGDPPEEFICSCPGFLHRGRCKHQYRVIPCDWKALDGPEQQTEPGLCPRCGNDTYEELYIDD